MAALSHTYDTRNPLRRDFPYKMGKVRSMNEVGTKPLNGDVLVLGQWCYFAPPSLYYSNLDNAALFGPGSLLAGQGHPIAIDDYGAGYMGLDTLIAPRPHVVRIDRGISRDPFAERRRGPPTIIARRLSRCPATVGQC